MYKSGMGYKSFVSGDKVIIEFPIKQLVKSFHLSPVNTSGDKIDSEMQTEFAEFIARTVVAEACQHDGATYCDRMLDSIYDAIFEGLLDVDFVLEGEE